MRWRSSLKRCSRSSTIMGYPSLLRAIISATAVAGALDAARRLGWPAKGVTRWPRKPCKPIAPARVQRQIAAESRTARRAHREHRWHAGHHAPVRVNRHREAVVGIAQQPAAVFHGSHARLRQMLRRRRRAAKPSVVRNVDQQLGAVAHEPPNVIREYRLVTNEDAEAAAGQIPHHVARALLKIGRERGEVLANHRNCAPARIR